MYKRIAADSGISETSVKNTISLFNDGCTIPFIARYRKEMTGGLDEVEIARIQMLKGKHEILDKRKKLVSEAVEAAGAMTPETAANIKNTFDLNVLEDIYLPYKPKRKTRATEARDKGLEPLAKIVWLQQDRDPESTAERFITDQVKDEEEALSGARDIMAEWINENSQVRDRIRNLYAREAIIRSTVVHGKETEGEKFRDYFSWEELLRKVPSHRLLAMLRGEEEGYLRVHIEVDADKASDSIQRLLIKSANACSGEMEKAIVSSYKRLIQPGMENEFRAMAKEKADAEAISVFAANLRQLLLQPPLGAKRVMAIDPGYRTGCKLVCLDEQGNLLHNETIYPHPPQHETAQSMRKIISLSETYRIDAVAIGNGTAGRETEQFISRIRFNREVKVFVVNEAGASIYSASAVAREEFPDYDVTVRGSVSIGRRLMDPLAELVKIDPKSIGVGQYQHDVNQLLLKQELDRVVESCVNNVGVELNTSSKHLLAYVSGLGEALAQNIVDYRKTHGAFTSRDELKKVPRLGERAFLQCAGFLRIANAPNPLDNSAVHPEAYTLVEAMAGDLKIQAKDLMCNEEMIKKIDTRKYITTQFGKETIDDIICELKKPGRDPRRMARVFEFDKDVRSLDDLREGMILPGIVTNITNFGAFVDVGVKQDGLVHISHLADKFITNPHEVVTLHQHVKVKVMEVDAERKRISLSMKEAGSQN